MKRLSLEDFKTKPENTKELESLTGGILGACHTLDNLKHNQDALKGKTVN